MALTLATTMRDALATSFVTLVGGSGTLVFATSGDVTVATLTLAATPFTGPSTGVLTLGGQPLSDTNAVGGVMAKFLIKTGGTTLQLTGSVGTTGENINFPGGLTVGAGDTVTLTTFTITVPAS